MGDWSGWSACSKDCGGGVMARSRPVEREAAYGGETCREPEETVGCNTAACDADCVTGFWGDWSACSKACGSGVRVRASRRWSRRAVWAIARTRTAPSAW